MAEIMTAQFWTAVVSIVLMDLLLGGDNAVVIALACRRLPAEHRMKGVIMGMAGAIILRVVLIFFALSVLQLPFLKLTGALLLIYIGAKLLVPRPSDGHEGIKASDNLWGAVKTIVIADLVMSMDNVIAVAGVAQSAHQSHYILLVVFGLLLSIPIIIWGSQFVMKLMDRFPFIITLGGMILGWVAGTMAVCDQLAISYIWPEQWLEISEHTRMAEPVRLVRYLAGAVGVALVLLLAWVLPKLFVTKGGQHDSSQT